MVYLNEEIYNVAVIMKYNYIQPSGWILKTYWAKDAVIVSWFYLYKVQKRAYYNPRCHNSEEWLLDLGWEVVDGRRHGVCWNAGDFCLLIWELLQRPAHFVTKHWAIYLLVCIFPVCIPYFNKIPLPGIMKL